MYCKLCRKNGRPGTWSDGTRNFRLKTIKQHAVSDGHRQATSADEKNQCTIDQSDARRKQAFRLALQAAFWIANEEIANVKYSSLIEFLQTRGLKEALFLNKAANAQYKSADIFNQLIQSLSNVAIKELKTALQNSPYVGLGIDESTDRSQEKHIAVIVRYISTSGQVVTTFLKLRSIKDGKASSLFDALTSVLLEFGLTYKKVVGLGADGVNVMSSTQNGLNGLVKLENPFCVYVHCVCHRLALAVSNCQQQIPSLKILAKIVGSIYNFVQYSKLERFKDISTILEQNTVKFKYIFEIRWLSLGEAITAVLRNYEALMVLLGEDANKGDPVAIGLHEQLSSYKYVALLHLMADILNTVNNLSKIFQYNNVAFSAIRTKLQDCMEILNGMQEQDGPHLTSFIRNTSNDNVYKGVQLATQKRRGEVTGQIEAFRLVRAQILATLLGNMRHRFPRVDILDAMQIFEPGAYPAPERLVGWGNGHLETLLNHFGQQQTSSDENVFERLVDPEVCRGEFLPFKQLVMRHLGADEFVDGARVFRFFKPTELMEYIFSGQENRKIYPDVSHLVDTCPRLKEIDLSDSTLLTSDSIHHIANNLNGLVYLALSRCHQIMPGTLPVLNKVPTLLAVDMFGMVTETSLQQLKESMPRIEINKFPLSSIARPTTGIRRTSLWELRVRDINV